MRLSVPSIPPALLAEAPALPALSVPDAVDRIAAFLTRGKGYVAALTGAGVSVDLGVRAYRGQDGWYMIPNFMYVVDLSSSVPEPDWLSPKCRKC